MDKDALYAAAIAGDADAIAKLEMEADRVNDWGGTILHDESENGNTERVRFILREFAHKNLLAKLTKFKHSALHRALYKGRTEVAEILIDAARHLPVTSFQAFLRQPSKNMNTALHAAVINGHVSIVKLLVEADPSDTHIQNYKGKTPMYIAVEEGYNHIVEIISTTCTAPSLDGPQGSTALHTAIKNLDKAKEKCNEDVIRMIIDAAKRWVTPPDAPQRVTFEALFNQTDESGHTVLELAVMGNHVNVVDLILKEGVLALILAMKMRDEDSVLRLLGDAKNLATFTEDNGWTPLHYAVYHEFDSILGAIIEAQEDVGHQFVYANMQSTPFYVAVTHGYTSTLIRLMQSWPAPSSAVTAANSPYTAVNEFGQNILHLAAADKNKEMVQGILKYCPEKYKDKILKQQDTNGDTPLHLLISHGCYIPELIKHKGLDTMAKNKNNFTPWDMLYLKNDVVADQVHIKIALDNVQTNQSSWNLWAKSTEKKTDIWKSIPPSKRRMKDVIFGEQKKKVMDEKHEQMKKDLKRYKMRTNTQIIVTALITTVTFTVGFTMPGGLHQSGEVDEGLVVLSQRRAFNVFMVSDALALLLSTSSLFFYFLESINEDPRQVSKLNAASTVLNIVSVMAMMLTFITGTYVVLSHSPALAITICVIGSLFFLLIIVLSIKTVYDRKVKRNED